MDNDIFMIKNNLNKYGIFFLENIFYDLNAFGNLTIDYNSNDIKLRFIFDRNNFELFINFKKNDLVFNLLSIYKHYLNLNSISFNNKTEFILKFLKYVNENLNLLNLIADKDGDIFFKHSKEIFWIDQKWKKYN